MFRLLEILKFDSALETLYLHKDQPGISIREIREKMPFKISEEELLMLLLKMQEERLITFKKEDAAGKYFITWQGTELYQDGGFLKRTALASSKKAARIAVMILGFISTLIGIFLGFRELF